MARLTSAGVDRRGQSVGRAIGEVERGGEIRHAIEAADGAEDLARRDFEKSGHTSSIKVGVAM